LPETLDGTARTALVVDDESNVVMVLERFLKRWGFQVHTALDGQTAIDRFRESVGSIDVVLLDLSMPGMGGEEVLAQLRSLSPDIPVILCTGNKREEAERRIGSLSGVGFLTKPFTPAQLEAALVEVFGESLTRH